MCDEKNGAESGAGRAGERAPRAFGLCAPMMRSMVGTFREIMKEAPEGSPEQTSGASEPAGSTGTEGSRLRFRERELVALGAAMGSNCVPCIEHHLPKARKAGLTDAQIRQAIGIADEVRRVPAGKVLDAALQLLQDEAADAPAGADAPPPSRAETPATAGGSCCG